MTEPHRGSVPALRTSVVQFASHDVEVVVAEREFAAAVKSDARSSFTVQ